MCSSLEATTHCDATRMRSAMRRFDHLFGMFRTAAGAVRRLDVILATFEERAFCILGCGTLKPKTWGALPLHCRALVWLMTRRALRGWLPSWTVLRMVRGAAYFTLPSVLMSMHQCRPLLPARVQKTVQSGQWLWSVKHCTDYGTEYLDVLVLHDCFTL